jgi:hypothetical protein
VHIFSFNICLCFTFFRVLFHYCIHSKKTHPYDIFFYSSLFTIIKKHELILINIKFNCYSNELLSYLNFFFKFFHFKHKTFRKLYNLMLRDFMIILIIILNFCLIFIFKKSIKYELNVKIIFRVLCIFVNN